jgi:glutamine cyclotransferase
MTGFLSRSFSIFLPILFALLGEVVVSSCATSPDSSSNHAWKNAIPRVPKDSPDSTTSEVVPLYTYKIVNTYPHDGNAFTQGLAFEDGILYEGTGLHGQSTLRKVELETGDILRIFALPARFFGEGVTIYGNNLIQLTWQSKVGFIYDKESFELLQEFNYTTEGWGITHDGKRLIMSDGTSTLYFLDPETFEKTGQIAVYDGNGLVTNLNELEYVKGEIYANIWKTDRIARIAPLTGQVMGWIGLENILSPEDRNHRVDALNGIAYDAKNDRLFVTGKFWPKIIEIEMILPDN